ncbi:hypothetical protein YC2023_017411 [Brassica napus]
MDPPMAQPHSVQASSTLGILTNAAARTMLSLHHSCLLETHSREVREAIEAVTWRVRLEMKVYGFYTERGQNLKESEARFDICR